MVLSVAGTHLIRAFNSKSNVRLGVHFFDHELQGKPGGNFNLDIKPKQVVVHVFFL